MMLESLISSAPSRVWLECLVREFNAWLVCACSKYSDENYFAVFSKFYFKCDLNNFKYNFGNSL